MSPRETETDWLYLPPVAEDATAHPPPQRPLWTVALLTASGNDKGKRREWWQGVGEQPEGSEAKAETGMLVKGRGNVDSAG